MSELRSKNIYNVTGKHKSSTGAIDEYMIMRLPEGQANKACSWNPQLGSLSGTATDTLDGDPPIVWIG